MASETELKLALAPRDIPALLAHPLLAAQAPNRQRLRNRYFDTPALALLERRMAVRERQLGRQTLLTVKTAGTVTGGLAHRGEWEAPTKPGQFDFAALIQDDATMAGELQALAGELVPVFSTDFSRRIWLLEHRGAQIEVALDQGHIRTTPPGATGARAQVLLELELELKHGPVDALFSLARKLGKAARLHPVTDSKAQRGYALFLGRTPEPVKSTPFTLDTHATPQATFRAVALSCLAHLQANEAGVLHSDDPEFLHQARVALRRLRAGLRLFAPALPRKFVARWSREWRALGQVLGVARDWDVLNGETLPQLSGDLPRPEAARLAKWAQAQGHAARAEARALLRGADYSAQLLAFTQAVLRLQGGSPPPAKHQRKRKNASMEQPALRRWAGRQLRARETRLQKRIAQTDMRDDEARHQVRIEAKKLRYGLDFFASLWPAKQVRPYTKALAAAQQVLGQMNDWVSTRTLLDAAPQRAVSASLNQRLDTRLAHDANHLPPVLAALRETGAPWRKSPGARKGGHGVKSRKK